MKPLGSLGPRCMWPLVRRVPTDRQLCDELLSRTLARLTGSVHATDDWTIRDALYSVGKLIAKRDGRELDLLLNPAGPCDKPSPSVLQTTVPEVKGDQ